MKFKIDDLVIINRNAWKNYLMNMGKSTEITIPPPQKVVKIIETNENSNIKTKPSSEIFKLTASYFNAGDLMGNYPAKYKTKPQQPIHNKIQITFPIDSIWNEEDLEIYHG